MAKTQTRLWDVAEHLKTDKDMAAYLEAAFEEGDHALIATALGDIARAKGMAQIARETGLSRESIYKALSSEGNPGFATVLKVVRALGLRLSATTVGEKDTVEVHRYHHKIGCLRSQVDDASIQVFFGISGNYMQSPHSDTGKYRKSLISYFTFASVFVEVCPLHDRPPAEGFFIRMPSRIAFDNTFGLS